MPCEHNGYVSSLAEALRLLDRYPWHRLYPLHAHLEFRVVVYDAVSDRYKSQNDHQLERLHDWKELCRISDD